jgi:hypothetical protein
MLKGHDFRYPQGCVLVEDSVTNAYRNLIRASMLVLALHDNPKCQVPGWPVRLDPKCEKQIREALTEALAEVEP